MKFFRILFYFLLQKVWLEHGIFFSKTSNSTLLDSFNKKKGKSQTNMQCKIIAILLFLLLLLLLLQIVWLEDGIFFSKKTKTPLCWTLVTQEKKAIGKKIYVRSLQYFFLLPTAWLEHGILFFFLKNLKQQFVGLFYPRRKRH